MAEKPHTAETTPPAAAPPPMAAPPKVEAPKPAPFVKPTPAKNKTADERYFELRETRQNEFFLRAPAHFEVEDVLKRECWAFVAAKLQVGTKIVIMREDGGFYLEVIVFAVGINWAEVKTLSGPIRSGHVAGGPSIADDYTIRYGGLIQEWVIERKSDGHLVKADGSLKSEAQAQTWLRDFLRIQGHKAA